MFSHILSLLFSFFFSKPRLHVPLNTAEEIRTKKKKNHGWKFNDLSGWITNETGFFYHLWTFVSMYNLCVIAKNLHYFFKQLLSNVRHCKKKCKIWSEELHEKKIVLLIYAPWPPHVKKNLHLTQTAPEAKAARTIVVHKENFHSPLDLVIGQWTSPTSPLLFLPLRGKKSCRKWKMQTRRKSYSLGFLSPSSSFGDWTSHHHHPPEVDGLKGSRCVFCWKEKVLASALREDLEREIEKCK